MVNNFGNLSWILCSCSISNGSVIMLKFDKAKYSWKNSIHNNSSNFKIFIRTHFCKSRISILITHKYSWKVSKISLNSELTFKPNLIWIFPTLMTNGHWSELIMSWNIINIYYFGQICSSECIFHHYW